MNFIFTWILDLFKKPEEEYNKWPFPAPVKAQRKRRAPAKKAPAKIVAKKTAPKKAKKA